MTKFIKCCSRGESLGVFQVESRAQMNMLPRLKPRTFYDLVIEVAIVRPGPIQGNMVHPYLKRRKMKPEDIDYPYPKGRRQKRTERCPGKDPRRAAVSGAGNANCHRGGEIHIRRGQRPAPGDGDIPQCRHHAQVRRARWSISMIERGYDPVFAQNCFDQIKGFGSYGFPESHAASFAQLVYVSSWLKHWHPDAFCCGLLNSQPMGFYAPAQIVGDARKNGVDGARDRCVVQLSRRTRWKNAAADYHAVRLGFRQIDGFKWADPDEEFLRIENNKRLEIKKPKPEDWGERIVAARERRPLHLAGGFRPRHRLAETRADPAGRCRCVSLHRPRSPRGTLGGAAVAG